MVGNNLPTVAEISVESDTEIVFREYFAVTSQAARGDREDFVGNQSAIFVGNCQCSTGLSLCILQYQFVACTDEARGVVYCASTGDGHIVVSTNCTCVVVELGSGDADILTFNTLTVSAGGAVIDFSSIDVGCDGTANKAAGVVDGACGAAVSCGEVEVIKPLNLSGLVTYVGARCC